MPYEFHHPYNFIPVTGKVNGQPSPRIEWKTDKQYDPGNNGARHDLWVPGTLSGRIVCRLHLDAPTVVGGEQIEEDGFQSKRVLPYRRNGQPAIPGNSLRGMIGSIAETLSQSSLRVLDDRMFSVRKPVEQGLSAIGMLKDSTAPDERAFDLVPLTMPTLRARRGRYQLDEAWRRVFRVATLAQCLPAYVDGYREAGTSHQPQRAYQAGSFLDTEKPDAFNAKTPVFYYAGLVGVPTQGVADPIPVGSAGLRETQNGMFLLGQRIQEIITQAEYDRLSTQQEQYTKGILRVLGIEGRETEIPKTKKHEVFIPMVSKPRLPVRDEVVNQFVSLANQRYADSKGQLPFALQGYSDWYPESGQLFFFDIDLDDHKNPYVSKISISSIWRKAVDATAWDFFRSIDRDSVPLHPGRTKLTPAELLFGVVEERKSSDDESAEEEEGENKPKEPPARALASRVRFHDALRVLGTSADIIEQPVTLKILSSPKPPCPSMYFHPRQGTQGNFVAKTDLSSDHHVPNGRKVYLHHPENHNNWESARENEHVDQKVRCTPLNANQDFYFHIDFDNLSKAELTLLLTSLRPSPEFRHRLGLGKSLGLGKVLVDVEGLFLVDRHQRYSNNALTSLRYHSVWQPQGAGSPAWSDLYSEEAARLNDDRVRPPTQGPLEQQAAVYDPACIDKATLSLVVTVGDPSKVRPNVPVQPPLLDSQNAHPESETFKWFVENENAGNQQALKPIQAGKLLPTLNTYP